MTGNSMFNEKDERKALGSSSPQSHGEVILSHVALYGMTCICRAQYKLHGNLLCLHILSCLIKTNCGGEFQDGG
jgi:hypothetical protein